MNNPVLAPVLGCDSHRSGPSARENGLLKKISIGVFVRILPLGIFDVIMHLDCSGRLPGPCKRLRFSQSDNIEEGT